MSQKLTSKQIRAVHLLAQCKSSEYICKTLSIRRETLSRWKRKPEFISMFESIMTSVEQGMKYRIINLLDEALIAAKSGLSACYVETDRVRMALSVLKLLGANRIFDEKRPEMPVSVPQVSQKENIIPTLSQASLPAPPVEEEPGIGYMPFA